MLSFFELSEIEVTFGHTDNFKGAILTGANKGEVLSYNYPLSLEEKKVLKEQCEKKRKDFEEEIVFQTFLQKKTATKEASLIYFVDITNTALTQTEAQELGAKLFCFANSLKEKDLLIDFSKNFDSILVAHIAFGFIVRSFCFDKYKVNTRNKNKISSIRFISENSDSSASAFKELKILADAINSTRSLSSEAPNVLSPKAITQYAKLSTRDGIKLKILNKKDMQKLNMNALLSVAQGSENEPYCVIASWQGGKKEEAPIALVGKGVTFDSGGISLKPSNNMHEMKEDMTGAAIVLSTLWMAAKMKLPINIVGVVGLVENMPSGTAYRPSDIIHSMSGQTIEVQNTDAEGRLVLADILYYTVSKFKPAFVVDFATLTGAIQVALGKEFAGLFSNNDEVSNCLLESAEVVKERLWRMPLDNSFDKDIDSDIADVKNVGSGRGAGSITAAHFLNRFIGETPWAHIDIAAVTFDNKARPLTGTGFTGFGVRLMHEFFKNVIKNPLKVKNEEKKHER